jgi:tetratricopeptide (TPR) repeat protein
VPESAEERLLAQIRGCDEILSEDGDSEDPVALRRVAESLVRKAAALRQLGRREEAIVVWAELASRQEQESSTTRPLTAARAWLEMARDLLRLDRPGDCLDAVERVLGLIGREEVSDPAELVTARALGLKARALANRGSDDDAVACDEELVRRFAAAEHPELRQWVAWALAHESRILIVQGRVDAAIAVSERLVARLDGQPAGALAQVAETINGHTLSLLQTGTPDLAGAVRWVLVILTNTTLEALHRVQAQITRTQLAATPKRLTFADRLLPTIVRDSRLRAQQALRVSQAVTTRIGVPDTPELGRAAASAEFLFGLALSSCGHPIASVRRIDKFISNSDQTAIEAFQRISHTIQTDGSTFSQVGALSNLALRAQMLGGGDPKITQIAYDDSIADHPSLSSPSTLTRLLTRWLRPRTKRKRST